MKTHEITAIGKSMRNTLIVCAAVPRRKICKFLICCFTEGFWEYLIYLAAIDQERNLALFYVDLAYDAQEVTIYKDVCESRTSKSSSLRRDGWATTAAWMTLSNARSNTRRAV